MANANKIKYGLKNVFIALCTESVNDETGVVTYSYGTPKSLPGAVSLSLDPEGENTPFYADNTVYFRTVSDNGYTGSLEIALIPDWFREDILKEAKDTNGVAVETSNNADTNKFAMMFQFEGDQKATKHVLHYCTATRPSVAGNTKEASIEPQTETLELSADPRTDGLIKARTTETTSESVYADWFKSVYVPNMEA